MTTYYLATNEMGVFHYGEMEDGMDIVTGQPILLFYNTKEELITALEAYGQQYQEPTSIEDMSESIAPLPNIEPPLPD
jgi:hypothetical protein